MWLTDHVDVKYLNGVLNVEDYFATERNGHQLRENYDKRDKGIEHKKCVSTAPWKNHSAWSDMMLWVSKYWDNVFHKRMIITHRTDLCQSDYLIEDRGKNGTSEFTAV